MKIREDEKNWVRDLLPLPAFDATPISPPCSSVSSLEMNRPSPEPPYCTWNLLTHNTRSSKQGHVHTCVFGLAWENL